jgi:hypothetical protein
MGRLLVFMLAVVGALSLAASGSASPAKTVEPWEYVQCGFVWSITDEGSTGPLTRDLALVLYDFPPLSQGGIGFHRVYHPGTMRGTVSGHITGGGVGTWTWTGDLRGVIAPDGMSGQFSLSQTPDSSSNNVGDYKIVGTWESEGHPVAPSEGNASPTYCVSFEAVIIGPF